MYKVIIVDDEYFSAKLLEKYIEEYIFGFSVIKIFTAASDAIKYLATNGCADVVMTDIKMHKMSGVELAKYIHTMKIDTEIIFVSAYADFEYAKEAMNYNVFGYLLKAIDIEELKLMMSKLKQKLDLKNPDNSDDAEMSRELFTENLILGKFENEHKMNEEFEKCFSRLPDGNTKCTVYKIEFDASSSYDKLIHSEGMEKIESALTGIIKCVVNKNYVDCIAHLENAFYIALIDEEDFLNIKSLEREIGEIFGVRAKIGTEVSKTLDKFINEAVHELDFLDKKKDEAITSSSDKESVVLEAVDYINNNIGKDLSRDSVAKNVGLSPVYFGRVFKEVMGVNFSDYVYTSKMKRAQELLKSGMKTTQVCTQIGVIDERQFRRSFKLYSKMTPAEYRKAFGNAED